MTTPPSPTRGSSSSLYGGQSSASVPASTLPTKPPRKRRWGLRILATLILFVGVGGALWTWIALSYRYAVGQRTGYVRNFTKNGWLCKTWEGEMMVAPIAGAPSPNFRFTVRSDSLATVIQNLSGKEVTLDYAEHVGIPSKCFGDTPFFIEGARASLP